MEDKCHYCGKPIAENLQFCPYCGKKQPEPFSEEEKSKNPYAILQVSENAEIEVIEATYKTLSKKYHPDVDSSSKASGKMKDINWAYSILKDSIKRKEWDENNNIKLDSKENDINTKICPFCGTVNNSDAISCSKCSRSFFSKNNSTVEHNEFYPETKEPKRRTKKYFPIAFIIAIMAIIYFIIGLFSSNVLGFIGFTKVTSTPTYTHVPTRTHAPTSTPKSIWSNCYSWNNMINKINSTAFQSICVYGKIEKLAYIEETFITVFEIENTDRKNNVCDTYQHCYGDNSTEYFMIFDTKNLFPDLKVGDCIEAYGHIFINKQFDKPIYYLTNESTINYDMRDSNKCLP